MIYLDKNTILPLPDQRTSESIFNIYKESNDIPIFCFDNILGELLINWGRCPGVISSDYKYKIYFNNNPCNYVIVSINQFIKLSNQDVIIVKELKVGDKINSFQIDRNIKNNDYIFYTRYKKYSHEYLNQTFNFDLIYHPITKNCCSQLLNLVDKSSIIKSQQKKAINFGLNSEFDPKKHILNIIKYCNNCKNKFTTKWNHRAREYCSDKCSEIDFQKIKQLTVIPNNYELSEFSNEWTVTRIEIYKETDFFYNLKFSKKYTIPVITVMENNICQGIFL